MSAAIVDARRLADMHALYRMFDERGHLLYIGITGDLGTRLGDHSAKRWFPLVERIALEWFPNRAAALVAEKRAIGAERPRYNQQRPRREPGRPGRRLRPVATQPKRSPRPVARRPIEVEPLAEDDMSVLLDDLGRLVAGSERMRLPHLPARLRNLRPDCTAYRRMTGVKLKAILNKHGIRTINTSGVHYLDPAELRRVRVGATSMRNSA